MRRLFGLGALVLSLLVPVPAVRATDQDAIDKAVNRGVDHLKKLQRDDGTWPHPEVGATALAGLTLLECGVPPSDPAVKKAAGAVRAAAVHLTHTYSVALAVLFLDLLGEEADVPLIESLTVRLLAGQTGNGGWHYQCPDVSETEARRLTGLLKQRNELSTKKPPPPGADKADDSQRATRKLSAEIQRQIEVVNREAAAKKVADGRDDNSNTQFAVLALWVARRHGLPTDGALALVDARFRSGQNGDGGWDYTHRASAPGARGGRSTPTMTCAGLLGLAVAHGAAGEAVLRTKKPKDGDKPKDGGKAPKPPDPTRDPAVRAGLVALGTCIDHPVGKKKGRQVPVLANGGKVYYFLWSLERVGVAYGLKTVGGKDWYGWGSELLVANQQADGGWRGDFSAMGADTCFALLFLKRANLARDLTRALKGKVEDPGEVVLTAGGVGGAGIKQRLGMKPALESPEMFGGTKSEGDRPPRAKPAAAESDAEAAKLSKQLVAASGAKQGALIAELRDAKGVAYTQALAGAIPHLEGDAKKAARAALAERMARMTSATLGLKLDDDDPEVRRAAALAVAMKEDKAHVGRLIDLLDDKEATVARAAHAALKGLSDEDFGPDAGASRAERKQAIAAWRAWWKGKR